MKSTAVNYWCYCAIVLLIATAIPLAAQNIEDLVPEYLETKRALYDLGADDLQYVVSDAYFTRQNGILHVYLNQAFQGVPVYNAVSAMAIKDGKVVSFANRFIKNLSSKVNSPSPQLTPEDAIAAAAAHLRLTPIGLAREETEDPDRNKFYFNSAGIAQQGISAALVYQPLEDGSLHLAWDVHIYVLNSSDYWNIRIDAATGDFLEKNNLTITCHPQDLSNNSHSGTPSPDFVKGSQNKALDNTDFNTPDATMSGSYNVYPIPVESPSHGGRSLLSDPDDPTASPYGWHDTNGAAGAEYTDTRGNNVFAQEDIDANNAGGARPDGGAGLLFDFPALPGIDPPSDYTDAATTNLFYMNNIMHDVLYHYGFDEAAGNFQENNYNNGGVASDMVRADAQDGSGFNNANFATPADGLNPRMQMFQWNYAFPNRDSDFDNAVIAHEYCHGLSNRLTGGPANVNCLSNQEQMGEGWSDFFALMLTMEVGDAGTNIRGIATYLIDEPVNGTGIRSYPYCTNMAMNPFTYDDIKTESVPHGVGSVWCTMLWDMTWSLIALHGYDPDVYHGNGGNNIAMKLVVEGMKLQPCSPGFIDARDAILMADSLLYNYEHRCLIWNAFARRGLGYSAVQGSTNSRSDGTQAFDLPYACQTPILAPMANFTVTPSISCDQPFAFTDLSINIPQTWLWDFGDGTSSNVPYPSPHIYATPGVYTITLTVSNILGTSSHSEAVTYSGISVSFPSDSLYCGQVVVVSVNAQGIAPMNYLWSDGQTTASISTTLSGTYHLTVTDAMGCTASASKNILVSPTPAVTISASPANPPLCVGTVLTANTICEGGVSTITFNENLQFHVLPTIQCTHWNDFRAMLTPRPYTKMTLRGTYDPTGKVCTDPTIIANLAFALRNVINYISPACNGNTWAICYRNGGELWVNSPTLCNINNCPNPGYILRPCSGYSWAGINTQTCVPPSQNVVFEFEYRIECTYAWSNGATTASITPDTSGTYTVTVTSGTGCTNTASYSVLLNPALSTTINSADAICGPGVLTTTTSGTAPFTYVWTGGATTDFLNIANTGVYTVSVTDASGCIVTASKSITVNPIPAVTISSSGGNCTGAVLTASPAVCPGGRGFITYDENFISGVIDTIKCVRWVSFRNLLTPRPYIRMTIRGTYDTLGKTCTDPVIISNMASAMRNFTAYYSPVTGGNVWTCCPYNGGNVWINPLNSCYTTSCPNLGYVMRPCCGDEDWGGINTNTCDAPDQNMVLEFEYDQTCTYLWNTGETTASISPGAPGNYTVTVTGAPGCSSSASYSIINPPFTTTIAGDQQFCGSGTVSAAPNGGAAPLTYWWTGAASTASITVTTSGNYALTVTDAGGCTATALSAITVLLKPTISISQITPPCSYPRLTANSIDCGPNGLITFSESFVLNAVPVSQCVNWDSFRAQLTPRLYTRMTVSGTFDQTGKSCTNQTTVANMANALNTLTDYISPSCGDTWALCDRYGGEIWLNPPSLCNGNNCPSGYILRPCIGQINGQVNWGGMNTPTCNPPNQTMSMEFEYSSCSYLWSNGATTQTITPNAPGTYSVTVTGSNGCTNTASANVTTILMTASITGGPSFCGPTGVLTANPINGVGPFIYNWGGGILTQSRTVNASGTYTVSITDAATFCIASTSINIVIHPEVVTTLNEAICQGQTYLFGAQLLDQAGTYQMVLVGNNGCDSTVILNLTVDQNPAPVIIQNGIALETGAFNAYQWFLNGTPINGATTQTYSPTQSGDYTVDVSDINGCTEVSPPFAVIISGTGQLQRGDIKLFPNPAGNLVTVSGLILMSHVTMFDATGQKIWSGEALSGSLNIPLDGLAAGMYYVRVTQDNRMTVLRLEKQ